MKKPKQTPAEMIEESPRDEGASATGSQTLLRGLDLLEAVVERPLGLNELAATVGLNRSTTHRLASALADRGYLRLIPRDGYRLGPKLLELGFVARQQIDLARVAHPIIEQLSHATGDAVHLGVLDGDSALYIDKIPGTRRVEIGSRVGERHPLCSTGLGKALLLDAPEAEWQRLFEQHEVRGPGSRPVGFAAWAKRMRGYVAAGCAFDLEENEDHIRCVAAPVRDDNGKIIAAISVSSAAQYMDDARMDELAVIVEQSAQAISREIGFASRKKSSSKG